MAAIAASADGQNIFIALENSGGFPVIVKTTPDDPATFVAVYDPGAGSAANVLSVPSDPDKVLFYGNFGSGVQVIMHTISTVSNANISPAGLTTKVVNALDVNPLAAGEIWLCVNTDQDLLRTVNGGSSYTTKNSALGITPTALVVLWPDANKILMGGSTGAQTRLLYSSNGGTSFTDVSSSGLHSAANIAALGVIIEGLT